MASHLKDALFAGVKKTLGVVSTHYIIKLSGVSAGYVVPDDVTNDEMWDFIARTDAAAESAAMALASIFYWHLFPDQDSDQGAD